MTISENIKRGVIELKKSNIESPNLKSRLLMQYVLGKTRQYIIVHDMDEMKKNEEENFNNAINELKSGVPIEHITHKKEFMKLNFYVDENVLIPRQDTEIVVEEIIKISKKYSFLNKKENYKSQKLGQIEKIFEKTNLSLCNANILDLCTGSGAIAVSLAKYLPGVKIVASDISENALKIAKENAVNNGVQDQIVFIESDLFENINDKKFDIIVSNPPYIKKNVIDKLDEQVKKEPIIALDGGEDGLEFYRKIINDAYLFLNKDGYLCFEIGYDQKNDVIKLLKNENKYKEIYCKKDLGGNDRVIVAKVN